MTVYVDEMRHVESVGRYQWWCHLTADTEEELHAAAAAVGMKRTWYQRGHYDIASRLKRDWVVANGAVQVTARELALKRLELIAKGTTPYPTSKRFRHARYRVLRNFEAKKAKESTEG